MTDFAALVDALTDAAIAHDRANFDNVYARNKKHADARAAVIAAYNELAAECQEQARLNGMGSEREASLSATNARLNRRCQSAESALPDYNRITALPPNGDGVRFVSGSLGRALASTAWMKAQAEIDSLRARLAECEAK